MRKLYWCCLGAAVVLGGASTAAWVAVREPHSFLGRAALTAGRFAAFFNPVAGAGAAFQCCREEAAIVPATAEGPAEVCESADGDGQPAPADPIRIPEEETVPPAPMPIGPDSRCPVQAAELALAAAECPPGEGAAVAPPVMPYCGEELSEMEAPAPDVLPMPRVAGDDEEQEEPEQACPLGGVHHMLRLFEKMLRKNAEAK